MGSFGDIVYAKLSDKENLPEGTLSGDVKQTILEGGGTCRIDDELEALVGLRYQKSEIDLRLGNPFRFDNEEDWGDAFAGFRWMPIKVDEWSAWLRADIGAGDSDLVWFAAANVAYGFNETWSALLGYRYLNTDYESGGFKWDVAQSGLGLAAVISW